MQRGNDGKDRSGHSTGSVPFFNIRRRARMLYSGRRRRILEEPIAALAETGREVVVHPEHRGARVTFEDGVIVEAGFTGKTRLFGSLIDTIWVGVRGEIGPVIGELTYRFDKKRFVTKRDRLADLADALSRDDKIKRLIPVSELKSIRVKESAGGRKVELIPLPGTITAVFLPPLPPSTVPLRLSEARAHVRLVRRILEV